MILKVSPIGNSLIIFPIQKYSSMAYSDEYRLNNKSNVRHSEKHIKLNGLLLKFLKFR